MIFRYVFLAGFAFCLCSLSATAENIVCPLQNELSADINKWLPDYGGLLEDVWLSRQFNGNREGAVVRCKRTIGSVQMILVNKSCRIVSAGGESNTQSFGTATEDTLCKIPLALTADTNSKTCMVICK
jgi:hypothetical protein